MVDYREILRLKSLGYKMNDIASSVNYGLPKLNIIIHKERRINNETINNHTIL